LVTTVFGKGIEKTRGSTTMNGLSGKASSKFSLALGGVSCTFHKELLPYEKYDLWTRILAWDRKWLYVVTHFIRRDSRGTTPDVTLYPQQRKASSSEESSPTAGGKVTIVTSALSKVVFKDGRKTISPIDMMARSDLVPTKDPAMADSIEEERAKGMHLAELLSKQIELEDEFQGQVALG
jgi:hypothetical protein